MATSLNFSLLTLNELNEASTISDADLFYILRFDPSTNRFATSGEKVTGATIKEYIGEVADFPYEPGEGPGNIFLIPEDGLIPLSMLPVANGVNKGIIGQATNSDEENILVVDGTAILNPVINISKINAVRGRLELSAFDDVYVNTPGYQFRMSEIATHNKIINSAGNTEIYLYNADGINPCYNCVNLTNNGITDTAYPIDISADYLEGYSNKIYKFAIIVYFNTDQTALQLFKDSDWSANFKANKYYYIDIELIPANIVGPTAVLVPKIITEI